MRSPFCARTTAALHRGAGHGASTSVIHRAAGPPADPGRGRALREEARHLRRRTSTSPPTFPARRNWPGRCGAPPRARRSTESSPPTRWRCPICSRAQALWRFRAAAPGCRPSNAVDVLLSDVYRRQPDPELQNAFFALSARAVFDAVTSGKGRPDVLLEGLTRSASRGQALRLVRSSRASSGCLPRPPSVVSCRGRPAPRRTSVSSSTMAPPPRWSTTSSTGST